MRRTFETRRGFHDRLNRVVLTSALSLLAVYSCRAQGPVIYNVAATNIGSNSATITWTTYQASTSQVNYGTTTSYGYSTPLDSTLTTSHSVTITGLTPATQYDFQAVSGYINGATTTFSANLTGYTMWAWGDSLTAGTGDSAGNTYPSLLATDIGVPVTNEGVPGWTSTNIAYAMLATQASFPAGNCHLIWSGRNDYFPASTVLSDIASMVAAMNSPKCFLVLSVINSEDEPSGSTIYSDIVSLNSSLAAAYPNNYLDVREALVQNYNPALILDVNDHANDVPPASLRAVTGWGTVTSGALDSSSCTFSVSNGTEGTGTVLIIDSETILLNGVNGNNITYCTRGYNGTTATPHAANALYAVIDPLHLGDPGYNLVAKYVAAALAKQYPFTFKTAAGGTSPAPIISNVAVSNITTTSAVVSWTTDQQTNSLVNYGTNSSLGSSSTLISTLTTAHAVTLTGLTPNTAYTFDVVSANSNGTGSTSPTAIFTTGSASGTLTPPYVGYVASWGINSSGATISWSTDVPANTELAYGTTAALGQLTPVQTALVNSHGVVLTGLTSGTTYYFVAESTGANGATGYSTTYSFTTSGTPPVTPAPLISTVSASSITSTSVTINWTTDQSSSSQVNYGASTSYGSSSPLNSGLTTTHSVTLTGLTPGTTYDYDVVSTNSSGTSAASANYTFTTSAAAAAPPVISNIQATAITSTSVVITWTTDKASNSEVNYGSTSAYGSSNGPDSNYVTNHSVTLTGLTAGTTYNYDVVSTTSASLSSTSGNGTFTTTAANATPPYVGYVAFWGINNSGVTISWSTDVLANTQLAYGTTPALGQFTPLQATLANSHGVTLTGLNSGTTYYFVAESTGVNGATGYSTTYSFTTTGTAAANPAPVISAVATGSITSTSATITWTTDQASTSQVNYGTTTSYTASSALNSNLTTSHSVTLSGLTLGTTYDFVVVSTNSSGTSATSPNATFTTPGSTPAPVISAVTAGSVTSGTATITWTTDQASSSQVNYGLTNSYGSASALSSALVTSHSVTLSGLAPNTKYNFDVVSANSASKSTTSGNYTFTTQASSATPPAVSNVAFWGITSSSIVISWSTDVVANTAVAYGTTTALGQLSPVQATLTNSHGVTLTGLAASTTYYFVAQSADSNGNTGYSTTYTFTTLAGPPTLSSIVATPETGHLATVSWTTSVPTYSYVQYGIASGNYGFYSPRTNLTTTPQCSLTYVPSGTIYFQVVSLDANGNQVVSPEAKFTEP